MVCFFIPTVELLNFIQTIYYVFLLANLDILMHLKLENCQYFNLNLKCLSPSANKFYMKYQQTFYVALPITSISSNHNLSLCLQANQRQNVKTIVSPIFHQCTN